MLKYAAFCFSHLFVLICFAQPIKTNSFGIYAGLGYQESILNIKPVTPVYFDDFAATINTLDCLYGEIGLLKRFKRQEVGLNARFCFVREELTPFAPRERVVRVIPHAFWVHYFGGKDGERFRGGATFTYLPYHYNINRLPGANPNTPPPVDNRSAYAAFGGIIGVRLFKKGIFQNTYANFNLQFALPNEFDKATSIKPGLQYNTTIGLSKPIYFK